VADPLAERQGMDNADHSGQPVSPISERLFEELSLILRHQISSHLPPPPFQSTVNASAKFIEE
jgi:hypothetical protein